MSVEIPCKKKGGSNSKEHATTHIGDGELQSYISSLRKVQFITDKLDISHGRVRCKPQTRTRRPILTGKTQQGEYQHKRRYLSGVHGTSVFMYKRSLMDSNV